MAEISFQKATTPVVDAEIVSETPRPAPAADAPAPVVETPVAVTPVVAAPVVNAQPVVRIPTTPAPAPTTAVAVQAPQSAVKHSNDPTELDDDNIGFEDVILPRINIVQKVGDLSNIFNGGEVVLNQESVIHEPAFIHPNDPKLNTPGTGLLNLTVLGFRKRQFTEKVAGGKLGMLLNSEADIAKNNGTLDYKEWQQSLEAAKVPGSPAAKRLFQRLGTALILVERPVHIPDEDHVLFPYDFADKWFALVLWSMKGTAYTNAAKTMFTARKIGHLRTGYTAQSWTLTTLLKEFDGNFAYIPVVKPGAKNSEEFRAFARQIIGAGN